MIKTSSMTINTAQIAKELESYFVRVMEKICQILITYIQIEIPMGPNDAHGKLSWRQDQQKAFTTLSIEAANSVVTGTIGLPYTEGREYIIAMIVDQGHSGEIWTRPGVQTYDDNMNQHTSGAGTSYRIPQFEQGPTNFMDNAKLRMASRFDAEMQSAFANIPKSIFKKNIKFG